MNGANISWHGKRIHACCFKCNTGTPRCVSAASQTLLAPGAKNSPGGRTCTGAQSEHGENNSKGGGGQRSEALAAVQACFRVRVSTADSVAALPMPIKHMVVRAVFMYTLLQTAGRHLQQILMFAQSVVHRKNTERGGQKRGAVAVMKACFRARERLLHSLLPC